MLEQPGKFPQRMVRVGSFYLEVDITPQFLEFLGLCLSAGNITDLARVSRIVSLLEIGLRVRAAPVPKPGPAVPETTCEIHPT